jgi:hypothetical protein
MINRGALVAGAVLVLANGAILVNAARNRAGSPDAVVRLTERELRSWSAPEEGAEEMLDLRLTWQMAPGPDGAETWFDRARLESLGVTDLPADGDSGWTRQLPPSNRKGYAVLELAGPAWERWDAAEQARQDSIEAMRTAAGGTGPAAPRRWFVSGRSAASRLMAVDVGLDPVALRGQYPDRSRYLIMPATYRAEFTAPVRDSLGAITTPARVSGLITQVLPGTVHVPRPLRDSLLARGAARQDSATHFEVTFKVGRRWEGWVE